MLVKRKLKPGDPGTKKYIKKYGEELVAVRYRYNSESKERITTVELIEDRGTVRVKSEPPHNKIVLVKVGYDEYALRERVKTFGATWNPELKLWEIDYRSARELRITSRIVEKPKE
ncbi:MAG: hypothetical protein KKA84_01915 [Bacteroidetes bacterium]|nr:hypothetical protein [Bacteroidota bacterium]